MTTLEEKRAEDLVELQAWTDWNRVEACLRFGVRKWGIGMFALWLSHKWLDPISDWLSLAADLAIVWLTFWFQGRLNARLDVRMEVRRRA
jgi:hypothetical protein